VKAITLHPGSAVAGAVLAAFVLVLVGAQAPVAKGVLGRNPRAVEVFSPPVPIQNLEYFSAPLVAESTTNQEIVTVHPGERLAILGLVPGNANHFHVLPVPLTDANADLRYDSLFYLDYGTSSAFASGSGIPVVVLDQGSYVFATVDAVGTTGSPTHYVNAVIGYRVPLDE
jgi:hypothetical protein